MRVLSFLLAIIVFYMSILTCSDSAIAIEVQESCTTQNSSHSHEHEREEHSHDGNDDCTPFCVCECCGAFITVPKSFTFEVEEIPMDHITCNSNFYSMNYSYNFNQGVWHPPSVC